MLDGFIQRGKMSFILGGQFGSEGKGAASAWAINELAKAGRAFDIITTNAGVQSGHTSIHEGKKRVLFHLPTAALMSREGVVYLNAGSIIDPDVLAHELSDNTDFNLRRLVIHPDTAVVTKECRDAEMANDSAQTKIASTRKGVGQALARKVLRSGLTAGAHPYLSSFARRLDLNEYLGRGMSILAEVPQGVSLSLNGGFYPHTTSRDCTVAQAASDAGIHPHFVGQTMLVLRTFPIRVGNIMEYKDALVRDNNTFGYSGGVYPDQHEISFADLGVEAEITTVTKRVRRIFTWSDQQVIEAIRISRPSVIFLSFCDYLKSNDDPVAHQNLIDGLVARIRTFARNEGLGNVEVLTAFGPTTANVRENLSR